LPIKIKVRVNITLEKAMEVQRENTAYLYSFFNLGAKRGWVVNATPSPLYSRERDELPITQESGWAQGPVCISIAYVDPSVSKQLI
jgi:hypothetical protein